MQSTQWYSGQFVRGTAAQLSAEKVTTVSFILWELGAVKMVPHPRGGFAFFQAEGMFLRKPADTLPENTEAGRSSTPLSRWLCFLFHFVFLLWLYISLCGLHTHTLSSSFLSELTFKIHFLIPHSHSTTLWIWMSIKHNCLYTTCKEY